MRVIGDNALIGIIIVSISLAGIFWMQQRNTENKKWEPLASAVEQEMQHELSEINILPGTVRTSYRSFHKSTLASVNVHYSTDKNYSDIQTFYIHEIEKNGWIFQKEKIGTGIRELTFRKGQYRLEITYWDKKQEGVSGQFAISLSWNRDKPLFGDWD